MKEIKLVLCDIDGTLLNDQGIITPKTKEAIKKCKDYGILFGIATGRPVQAVEGLLEGWGIKEDVDILLGFNGALVHDYTLNKEFKSDLISGQYLKQIIEEYEALNLTFGIFEGKTLYVNKPNEISYKIASKNRFSHIEDDLTHFYDTAAFKMLAINEKEVTDQVALFHKEHPHDYFKGVRSTPNLYEFMNPSISKSHGIETVAKAHGWTLDNVLVFGDEMNDMEMIRDCGLGVCMDNGNPLLKEIANATTLSNNDDGIAYYLNTHIFKER